MLGLPSIAVWSLGVCVLGWAMVVLDHIVKTKNQWLLKSGLIIMFFALCVFLGGW
jgi:hypothetical protein